MKPRARGKLYIDKRVQGALARRVLTHWGLFFMASSVTLLALQYFLGEPGLTLGEHLSVIWSQYALFVVLMVAMLPSFVYDTIRLSNRFAGPIVRLRRGLQELNNGEEEVEHMNFRDGDFWLELSDDFNQLAEKVKRLENEKSTSETPAV